MTASRSLLRRPSVPVERYPYVAGLMQSEDGKPFCEGILIAPNIVLTAAHCQDPFFVLIGCDSLETMIGDCEVFTVSSMKRHPDFDPGIPGLPQDVALVILNGVVVHDPIAFLAGKEFDYIPDQEFSIMGRQLNSTAKIISNKVFESHLNYVPQAKCEANYPSNLTENHMCAEKPAHQVCIGRAGSPLVLNCDKTKNDVLVGIASWTIGCVSDQHPGVYTRVSKVIDFIKKAVAQEGHSLVYLDSQAGFCTNSLPSMVDLEKVTSTSTHPLEFLIIKIIFYSMMGVCVVFIWIKLELEQIICR